MSELKNIGELKNRIKGLNFNKRLKDCSNIDELKNNMLNVADDIRSILNDMPLRAPIYKGLGKNCAKAIYSMLDIILDICNHMHNILSPESIGYNVTRRVFLEKTKPSQYINGLVEELNSYYTTIKKERICMKLVMKTSVDSIREFVAHIFATCGRIARALPYDSKTN